MSGVTKSADKWGNPTFTVGVLTITAFPERGRHAQIDISDYDYKCLNWSPDDLRDISEAFSEAARAAEGCECDEPACQWCEVHGDTGNPPITNHDPDFNAEGLR